MSLPLKLCCKQADGPLSLARLGLPWRMDTAYIFLFILPPLKLILKCIKVSLHLYMFNFSGTLREALLL